MRKIWKYVLPREGEFDLEMPYVVDFLDVQIQREEPCLWAMVIPESKKRTYHFKIVGTGHSIPDDAKTRILSHIGTFQDGVYVWHLFEVPGMHTDSENEPFSGSDSTTN